MWHAKNKPGTLSAPQTWWHSFTTTDTTALSQHHRPEKWLWPICTTVKPRSPVLGSNNKTKLAEPKPHQWLLCLTNGRIRHLVNQTTTNEHQSNVWACPNPRWMAKPQWPNLSTAPTSHRMTPSHTKLNMPRNRHSVDLIFPQALSGELSWNTAPSLRPTAIVEINALKSYCSLGCQHNNSIQCTS